MQSKKKPQAPARLRFETNAADRSRWSGMSSASQPYFVLKAANGQVIGTSEMYSSEAARDSGIASVQSNSPSTTVKEE